MGLAGVAGVVLSIGLTGCAAQGPKFSGYDKPKQNKGLLYVYRPSSFGAGGKDYFAYDEGNKKLIGVLENGSYLKYNTSPGKKSIGIYEKAYSGGMQAFNVATQGLKFLWMAGDISKPRAVYTVNVKQNDIACIKWDAGLEGIGDYNGVVSRKTCNEEIVKTSRVVQSK